MGVLALFCIELCNASLDEKTLRLSSLRARWGSADSIRCPHLRNGVEPLHPAEGDALEVQRVTSPKWVMSPDLADWGLSGAPCALEAACTAVTSTERAAADRVNLFWRAPGCTDAGRDTPLGRRSAYRTADAHQ
jgi:hypothetical protein